MIKRYEIPILKKKKNKLGSFLNPVILTENNLEAMFERKISGHVFIKLYPEQKIPIELSTTPKSNKFSVAKTELYRQSSKQDKILNVGDEFSILFNEYARNINRLDIISNYSMFIKKNKYQLTLSYIMDINTNENYNMIDVIKQLETLLGY